MPPIFPKENHQSGIKASLCFHGGFVLDFFPITKTAGLQEGILIQLHFPSLPIRGL